MKLERIKAYLREKKQNLRHNKPGIKQILFWIALGIFGLFLLCVLSIGILVAVMSVGLPDVHDLDKISTPQSTTIYDREGNVLYVKYGGENRQYVNYDQISPQLIDATVAIEDDQYWQHPGFDASRIIKSIINNTLHLSPERGASTITQQYIKLTFLSSEKSYIRKLKELILAIQLEQAFDKKKILELYLNKIPYSNNAYGIEKAAQIYFSKHAKDLDLAESATLASIPQAPSYYNPYGPHLYSTLTKEFAPEDLLFRHIQSESDFKDNEFLRGLIGKEVTIAGQLQIYIQGRSDLVLKRMETLGYITSEETAAAQAEIQKPGFIKEYHEQISHPHFVFYILNQLEQQYGKEVIEQGGLSVYTTLDPKLQNIAEKAVKDGATANEKKYNANNAALVAIDPKTGQILAMVGSRDYFDTSIDGNENVTTDYRQPGSSFKPFVYAQAFYNRYAPASVVFDTETKLGLNAYPKNFDGKFWGPMPMRKALGQSRNIPAIKTYFLAGEQKPIIDLAERMGITFQELLDDPNHDYGWTLAIGTAGVRLIDMVSAFGVFAADGIRHEPVTILKIQNAKGDILEQWTQDEGKPVLDPQVAYLINSILSDTSVRLSQNMTVPGQINAAKSGTSNRVDKTGSQKIYYPHDLWTIGYTTKLVAGVWVGNNRDQDGNIGLSADGISTAAPIWKNFMTEALKDSPSEDFPVPEGIRQVAVSTASGKLPGPLTPPDQIHTDIFASFSVPTEIDDSYVQVDIDTLCGKLANEFTPEEMKKKVTYMNMHDIAPIPEWEQGAQDWLKQHNGEADANNASLIVGPPPTESCPGRTAANFANRPTVTFLYPANGSVFASGSRFTVQIQVNALNTVKKVDYFIDDQAKYTTVVAPYDGLIRLPVGESPGASHTIMTKVFDNAGYVGTTSINITTAANVSSTAPLTIPDGSTSLSPPVSP